MKDLRDLKDLTMHDEGQWAVLSIVVTFQEVVRRSRSYMGTWCQDLI